MWADAIYFDARATEYPKLDPDKIYLIQGIEKLQGTVSLNENRLTWLIQELLDQNIKAILTTPGHLYGPKELLWHAHTVKANVGHEIQYLEKHMRVSNAKAKLALYICKYRLDDAKDLLEKPAILDLRRTIVAKIDTPQSKCYNLRQNFAYTCAWIESILLDLIFHKSAVPIHNIDLKQELVALSNKTQFQSLCDAYHFLLKYRGVSTINKPLFLEKIFIMATKVS